jgi:S1-C subfamily serine protease
MANDATTLGQSTYMAVRQQPSADSPDAVLGGKLELDRKTDPRFIPNNIGLLLDEQGRLLVPLYVEREAVGDKPVPVAGPDGVVVDARFVGCDRQTNLTLLEIQKPAGRPVRVGKLRPATGSLVLCLCPADASGRLSLWTEGAQLNGVIVNTEGEISGIARGGQFLAAPACRLIADHLTRFGAVKRATLGITVSEVREDDSPRPRPLVFRGSHAAVRVDDVIPGSVADKAGIKPGDLLLSMGAEPVTDLPSFAAAIAARDGQTDFQVLRGDNVTTLSAYLQQQK